MTNTKRIEDLAGIAWARINDEVYQLDSEITENERIYCVQIIADAIKEALSPPAASEDYWKLLEATGKPLDEKELEEAAKEYDPTDSIGEMR